MISKAYAMAPAPVDPASQPSAAQSLASSLIPVAVIFAIFYFLIIRPQKKRDEELKKLLDGLKKGDEVLTQSGIYGRIAALSDGEVTLEVAQNVKIKMTRSAIAGLAKPTAESKSEVA